MLAMTVYFLPPIIVARHLKRNMSTIKNTLQQCFEIVDESYITRFQKHERSNFLARLICIVAPSIVSITYMQSGSEKIEIYASSFYRNQYEMMLHSYAFTVSYFMLMFLGQFFASVLTAAKELSNYCKMSVRNLDNQFSCRSITFCYPNEEGYTFIMASLQRYFTVVKKINETMGIIPLAMFTVLFMDFIFGMTFLILKMDQISIEFGFFCLICSILNQVWGVGQCVIQAHETTTNIEEAIEMADSIARKRVPETASFSLLESRRALSLFLQRQKVIRFQANSFFTLEPSVVLTFFNSVIPFTVMFMTAIAQISNREPISCQVNDWITNSTQQ